MKQLVFSTIALFIFSTKTVYAAPQLSEIFPNPVGSDAEAEFIEIYNPTESPIALDQYQLDDKTDSGSKSYQLSGTLAASSFKVVPYSESRIVINNSNETIQILKGTEVIDLVSFTTSKEGQSYAKNANQWQWQEPSPGQGTGERGDEGDGDSAQESSSILRKSEIRDLIIAKREQLKKEKEYSSAIKIIEALINPEGDDRGKEWIKLQNTSDQLVDLSLWQLDDKEGGSPPYILATKIKPNESIIILSSDSNINLNNSGDEIRLISPDQKIKDHIAYKKAQKDEVLTRKNNWKSKTGEIGEQKEVDQKKEEKKSLCKLKNNEVHFNEIQNNQFIELKNTTKNTLSLVGCVLSNDLETHVFEYAKIKANGLLKLDAQILDISLDAEHFLIKNDTQVITEITTSQLPVGHSFARNQKGQFKITTTPTPGFQNSITHNKAPFFKEDITLFAAKSFDAESLLIDPEKQPLTSIWSFGDSSRNSQSKHTFLYPGTYTITASVFDGVHQIKLQKEIQVKPFPSHNGKLIISELLPQPQNGQSEWIEIYNNTSNAIDISGFSITDANTAKWTIPEGTIIARNAYMVFPREHTKIALTASQDTISLLSPDNTVVDTLFYDNAPNGQSLMVSKDGPLWTEKPTPGQRNVLQVQALEEIQPIVTQDIKQIPENQQIKLSGIVSIPTGHIFPSYFFLESGVPVRVIGTPPSMKEGQLVTITGEVEDIDTFKRLKTRAQNIVLSDIVEPIAAIDLTQQELKDLDLEQFAFQNILIKGDVKQINAQQLQLGDIPLFMAQQKSIYPPLDIDLQYTVKALVYPTATKMALFVATQDDIQGVPSAQAASVAESTPQPVQSSSKRLTLEMFLFTLLLPALCIGVYYIVRKLNPLVLEQT